MGERWQMSKTRTTEGASADILVTSEYDSGRLFCTYRIKALNDTSDARYQLKRFARIHNVEIQSLYEEGTEFRVRRHRGKPIDVGEIGYAAWYTVHADLPDMAAFLAAIGRDGKNILLPADRQGNMFVAEARKIFGASGAGAKKRVQYAFTPKKHGIGANGETLPEPLPKDKVDTV